MGWRFALVKSGKWKVIKIQFTIIKQPIDTTKEIKFYVSRVMPAGAMIFSLIFGFGAVLFLLGYDYHNLHLDLTIGILTLLVCMGGLVWGIYILFFNPLLLAINRQEIYLPGKGSFPWSSIKSMALIEPSVFTSVEREPPFLQIIFLNDTSYDLSIRLFSVRPYKLLEILRTYHGSLPKDRRAEIEDALRVR